MTIQHLIKENTKLVRNSKGIGIIELVYSPEGKLIELITKYPKSSAGQKTLAKDAGNILDSKSNNWEAVVVEEATKEKKKK